MKVAEKDRSKKEKFMAAPQAARHPEAGISEKESVEVEFHLTSYVQTSVLLKVQILVATDELLYPIIHGYNVVEETIRKSDKEEAREQFLTL